MRLGDILVARGMVTVQQVEDALNRQIAEGGRLGDNLVALGHLTNDQLDDVMHETPRTPKTLMGTAISLATLQTLLMKFLYVEQIDTTSGMAEAMKLPMNIISQLFRDAEEKKYVQSISSEGVGLVADVRYELSERGRAVAADYLERSLYLGPAPVSLSAFQEQVLKQRITNEVLDKSAIEECFAGLIVPDFFTRQIGPAINSGRTMLLYGPPGNGKTSIATAVSKIFQHIIYVPYAIEVEGHIIQVYDSTVHEPAVDEESAAQLAQQTKGLRREDFDQRWMPVRRPVVVVGGEFSLEMLELSYNPDSKYYEAPMHIKALGGTFIVDDFGRQLVAPEALLNRWIVPMESRIDFFKLRSGKSFYLPFDELLIFSTNLEPSDLMDPAFLRRIPYKIELFAPSKEDYRTIFDLVAKNSGLVVADDVFDYVVEQLQDRNDYELAYYQPKFICDQVLAACKYESTSPEMTMDRVADAMKNLYVKIEMDPPPRLTELPSA
jgi:energy-coupling factor transporter ATP-binding protein EcfA2